MPHVRWTAMLALAGCTFLSGPGAAAPPRHEDHLNDETSIRTAEDDRPLLAGPEIEESESSGALYGNAMLRRADVTIPPQRWLRLIRLVDLRPDQRTAIRRIEQAFRERAREFRTTHGKELDALNQRRRAAQVEDGPPLTPQDLARFREIMQHAPGAAEAQQKIWAILDEDQQTVAKDILESERQRLIDARLKRDQGMTTSDQMSQAPDDPASDSESDSDAEEMDRDADDTEMRTLRDRIRDVRRRQRRFYPRRPGRPRGAPPWESDYEFSFNDGHAGTEGANS